LKRLPPLSIHLCGTQHDLLWESGEDLQGDSGS
jgi:hypothetical protein